MTVEGVRLAQEQLALARRFVSGALPVRDFVMLFLRARNAAVATGGGGDLDLLDMLNDVWFAIDMHNEYDDLREPDEFDDAQLLDVVTGYLASWDAGTWQPDPRWEG
jgi:Bacterial self-protective colicin-like immunity